MAQDIGYGIDTSVLDGDDQDLDDTFTEMSGPAVLGEDVYKAVSSPSAPVVLVEGEFLPLLFWEDPPVSFSLADLLNDSLSPADLSTLQGRIERIYVDDRRFDALSAKVALAGGQLSADITGEASGEPLQMRITAGSRGIVVEARP